MPFIQVGSSTMDDVLEDKATVYRVERRVKSLAGGLQDLLQLLSAIKFYFGGREQDPSVPWPAPALLDQMCLPRRAG